MRTILALGMAAMLASAGATQAPVTPGQLPVSTFRSPALASPAGTPAEPAPPCVVPAAWAGAHRPLAALARPGGSPVPLLTLGQATDLALAQAGRFGPAVPLARPPLPDDRGGLVGFHAALAARYTVWLGARAWIDMTREGKAIESVAHGMGCAGIAKFVAFDLAPGDYLLQLSGSTADVVPLLVTTG